MGRRLWQQQKETAEPSEESIIVTALRLNLRSNNFGAGFGFGFGFGFGKIVRYDNFNA